jgi:hypothetical protein
MIDYEIIQMVVLLIFSVWMIFSGYKKSDWNTIYVGIGALFVLVTGVFETGGTTLSDGSFIEIGAIFFLTMFYTTAPVLHKKFAGSGVGKINFAFWLVTFLVLICLYIFMLVKVFTPYIFDYENNIDNYIIFVSIILFVQALIIMRNEISEKLGR